MDNYDIDLDNELARRTAVLVDSSDDEASVAPINDSGEEDLAPDLQEVFGRYDGTSELNRVANRRLTFIIRRG